MLTIYKSFVGSHLDYGDTVYDRTNNEPFISKLKQLQYNAAPATTGPRKCTSRIKV